MTKLANRVKEKSGGEPYGFDWRWIPIADLNLEELPESYDWEIIVRWLESTFDGEVVVTVEEEYKKKALLCVEKRRNDHPLDTDSDREGST